MAFLDDLMDMVQPHIPKTCEDSHAKSQVNPVGQRFNDYTIGNFFERVHGYNGTEVLYTGHVVTLGGNDKVATNSYLGVIARYFKAVFSYGDDSAVDADPIYNVRESKPDIVTGGTSIPNINSLEGSVLYTRVENIFAYFSTKTKWIINETDGVKDDIVRIDAELATLLAQLVTSSSNQSSTNISVDMKIIKIENDILSLQGRMDQAEDDIKQNMNDIGYWANRINNDVIRIDAEITGIKTFIKMP